MLAIKTYRTEQELKGDISREEYVDFLYDHLDKFRDSKESINLAIDYALSKSEGKGGFLMAAYYEGKLVGELLMINSGMKGFIPENILVYIAVDSKHRGKGFGRKIIEEAFKNTEGEVKLHVEYDNPAKRLYERVGFTTKYAEMRYRRND